MQRLERPQELRALKVYVRDGAFGPNYSHLRQFLSQKRNITVMNGRGTIYSDGNHVDKLYSLNAFFRGSADPSVKPSPERPLLFATALLESAWSDFQRSALLLTDHADVLLETLQCAH